MGIENRDYIRRNPAGERYLGRSTRNMVTTLIIINVIVFVAQVVTIRDSGVSLITEWFGLNTDKVMHGQIWRIATYDFLHDDQEVWHLVFNMLLLFMAGRRVESAYGSREFLWFYLLAGILSGVFNVFWNQLTHVSGMTIGASGAVVAVMIVYAMNWPHERWFVFYVLPVPVAFIALFAAATDLYPMLRDLSGHPINDHVAHSAHIAGMAFAFLYVRNNWRVVDWIDALHLPRLKKMFKRRPKLRVHAPDPDDSPTPRPVPLDVETRLDQLLAKIASHGEASLSDEERSFLAEASRRYRNRK